MTTCDYNETRLQEATRILRAMSPWLDEDRLPCDSTLMPDSEVTFGEAIRNWLLYRTPTVGGAQ